MWIDPKDATDSELQFREIKSRMMGTPDSADHVAALLVVAEKIDLLIDMLLAVKRTLENDDQ